jgi:gliding motility-associated lipoprotein GldD
MGIGIAVSLLALTSCSNNAPTPRPRAFPKVHYPQKAYQRFDASYCDFTFAFPTYARIQQDTQFFEEKPEHPCWFDIYIPDFDSRIHCSYYPVGDGKSLEELRADAFELVDWHNKRANYIEEIPIRNASKEVYGFAFRITGPAASPYQFFLTDRQNHFLRGALYFNTQARPDSLLPVVSFLVKDIEQLIETFAWKPRS